MRTPGSLVKGHAASAIHPLALQQLGRDISSPITMADKQADLLVPILGFPQCTLPSRPQMPKMLARRSSSPRR